MCERWREKSKEIKENTYIYIYISKQLKCEMSRYQRCKEGGMKGGEMGRGKEGKRREGERGREGERRKVVMFKKKEIRKIRRLELIYKSRDLI